MLKSTLRSILRVKRSLKKHSLKYRKALLQQHSVTSHRNIVFRNSVVSTSLGRLFYDVAEDLNMFTSGKKYSPVKCQQHSI
jgi:hypothetical protein